MGAECSTDAPETKAQRSHGSGGGGGGGHAVVSAVPSPMVSSFDESLTSDSEKGTAESGCSGRRSFVGYVPLAKIMQWRDELPPPETLQPVPEDEIWSDGEREMQQWRQSDDGGVNAANEGRWDAPKYVSALDIGSPLHKENSTAFTKGQKVSGFRC